ncbi:fimbrial protein [Pseudomonas lactis]|uniref:Putative fimbrial protein n=1 Tax=Pseudomonas lactis TaxID=1615674 RepID=I4K4K3_9PSED|nr:fimbrial protein [Pseudomonas lactis]EIK59643.1 putative fimbrial protein [Pseudomonas lactis]
MKGFFSLGSIIRALMLYAIAQTSHAAVSCGVDSGGPSGIRGTMALQISSLTVPRDTPNGTQLYIQNFRQAGVGTALTCTPSILGTLGMTPHYIVRGLGANTNSTANVYYANKIYETGVPGIGVAWKSGHVGMRAVGSAFEFGPMVNDCQVPIVSGLCRTGQLKFDSPALVLIKTGPVGAGVINASALGMLQQNAKFHDSPIYTLNEIGVTGSINVVSRTCQTPDVQVLMGSHKTSSLTGKGSSTPEVVFHIPFANCPGFPGYYGNTSAGNVPSSSENGVINSGVLVNNTISFRIEPMTTPIDATNGVLSLTTGAGMATGVGVKITYPKGKIIPLYQNQEILFSPLIGADTTGFSLSFAARYVQTADKVTPGQANAVATYTIIYK